MRTLIVIQIVWASLLGLAGLLLTLAGNPSGFALLAIALIYGYVIDSLGRRKRWAWWFCCVFAVISIAVSAPNVVYNFFLYAQKDELYRDSPATIFIVAINAFVLVVPAILSLTFLLTRRKFLSDEMAQDTQAADGGPAPKGS